MLIFHSDYETPPSSPEQPELGDDFETENQESTTLNQPINKTRPKSQPLVPFRLIATTQVSGLIPMRKRRAETVPKTEITK